VGCDPVSETAAQEEEAVLTKKVMEDGPTLIGDNNIQFEGSHNHPMWGNPVYQNGSQPELHPDTPWCPQLPMPHNDLAYTQRLALHTACMFWSFTADEEYLYQADLEFPRPEQDASVLVFVDDNAVERAWEAETFNELNPENYGTIRDVFFGIADLIDLNPYDLYVEYDELTGQPVFISVDLYADVEDDWMTVSTEMSWMGSDGDEDDTPSR